MADDIYNAPGLNIQYRGSPTAVYGRSATASAQPFQNLVIHHTDDDHDAEWYVNYGNQVDAERGGAFGYHFYIGQDGTVYQGAPLGARTNHVLTNSELGVNNANSISISIVGGSAGVSPAAQAAAEALGASLMQTYGITGDKIFNHGDVNPGHRDEERNNVGLQTIISDLRSGRTGTPIAYAPGQQPAGGAAGAAAEMGAGGTGGAGGNYTIRQGDSFWSIAGQVLGDPSRYAELQALNPGVDPRALQPGQTLRLPGGTGGAPAAGGAGPGSAAPNGQLRNPLQTVQTKVRKGLDIFNALRERNIPALEAARAAAQQVAGQQMSMAQRPGENKTAPLPQPRPGSAPAAGGAPLPRPRPETPVPLPQPRPTLGTDPAHPPVPKPNPTRLPIEPQPKAGWGEFVGDVAPHGVTTTPGTGTKAPLPPADRFAAHNATWQEFDADNATDAELAAYAAKHAPDAVSRTTGLEQFSLADATRVGPTQRGKPVELPPGPAPYATSTKMPESRWPGTTTPGNVDQHMYDTFYAEQDALARINAAPTAPPVETLEERRARVMQENHVKPAEPAPTPADLLQNRMAMQDPWAKPTPSSEAWVDFADDTPATKSAPASVKTAAEAVGATTPAKAPSTSASNTTGKTVVTKPVAATPVSSKLVATKG